MNFDPQKIYDVDTNIEGKTINMPEYQPVSIAASGATEEAEAVFPFFDPDVDPDQLAYGWRYPVGTVGGYSGQNWRECASCNKDYGSNNYQIIDGKAYCIPSGCLEQKLAQKEEGGPLFEESTIPASAILKQ